VRILGLVSSLHKHLTSSILDSASELGLLDAANRKIEISTTPTKAESKEPAYSQAIILNKIDLAAGQVLRVGQVNQSRHTILVCPLTQRYAI